MPESSGDTWLSIDQGLRHGLRGLRGGSSLFRLLADRRGVGRHARRQPLSIPQILAWADAFHARTGRWPTMTNTKIPAAPGISWWIVHDALDRGRRTLPGGTTLARLLAEQRNVRSRVALPRLSRRQILKWAQAHHQKHGRWPTQGSGVIPGGRGETWSSVSYALKGGRRGLTGSSTLAEFVRNANSARR